MTREELQSILDDIDPEGTGKLDYAEVGQGAPELLIVKYLIRGNAFKCFMRFSYPVVYKTYKTFIHLGTRLTVGGACKCVFQQVGLLWVEKVWHRGVAL